MPQEVPLSAARNVVQGWCPLTVPANVFNRNQHDKLVGTVSGHLSGGIVPGLRGRLARRGRLRERRTALLACRVGDWRRGEEGNVVNEIKGGGLGGDPTKSLRRPPSVV